MSRARSLLVGLLLMVLARGALAGESSPRRTLQPNASTVSADLDGDNRPDIAIGQRSGLLEYTVEVRFSSQIPSAILRVASASAGISLSICDVNRDSYPDVVIRAATSVIPVAIWLGDGKGHFREGDPWQYIPLRMDPPPRIGTDADSRGHASILTETRSDPAAKPAEGFATDAVRRGHVSGTSDSPASRTFAWQDPSRSPPLFF